MMFGRVRASSSSSLDSFEERLPSKIFKDDPLSIYETTLIKLKLGSQRDLSMLPPPEDEMESDCSATTVQGSPMQLPIFGNSTNVSESCQQFPTCSPDEEEEEAMAMDIGDRCYGSIQSSPSGGVSTSGSSKQLGNSRNMSVVHLFSKYKSCRDVSSCSLYRELTSSGVGYGSATASTSWSSSGSTKEDESRTSDFLM